MKLSQQTLTTSPSEPGFYSILDDEESRKKNGLIKFVVLLLISAFAVGGIWFFVSIEKQAGSEMAQAEIGVGVQEHLLRQISGKPGKDTGALAFQGIGLLKEDGLGESPMAHSNSNQSSAVEVGNTRMGAVEVEVGGAKYTCATASSGSACKTCPSKISRNSNNQCNSCNSGFHLLHFSNNGISGSSCVGEPRYVGCYKDDADRDLKNKIGAGYDKHSCQETCQQYKYFALQGRDKGECWCDNTFSTPANRYPKVADSECGTEGEYSRNMVYEHPTGDPSCPSGYHQVGTLSSNNDIGGLGLGQISGLQDIYDCGTKCVNHEHCVAFMWESNIKICELSAYKVPNNSWGSNYRFCAGDTRYHKSYQTDRNGGDISCGQYDSHSSIRNACTAQSTCVGYTIVANKPWCLKTTTSASPAYLHDHDYWKKM